MQCKFQNKLIKKPAILFIFRESSGGRRVTYKNVLFCKHFLNNFAQIFRYLLKFIYFPEISISQNIFFFYLGFFSRAFTIHRTARKVGGYLFNSSSTITKHYFHPLYRQLDNSRAITAEGTPLHIANIQN